jgi:Ca2+-binding EF-hand superfamily protein
MKTIPVSLLLAGILMPAICEAQPQGGAEGDKDPRRKMVRGFGEVWKSADANGDGFISLAEFSAMPRIQKLPEEKREALFTRLDKDGDGKLSRGELEGFGRNRDGAHLPPMKRLWELDTDKSGGICFEEFKRSDVFAKLSPEMQEGLFKRLDSDGDGMITPKDRPEPPAKRPDGKQRPGKGGREGGEFAPEQMLRKLDTNGDGALSFEEFRVGPAVKDLSEDEQEERFLKLDRNGDQQLTAEDFPPRPEP